VQNRFGFWGADGKRMLPGVSLATLLLYRQTELVCTVWAEFDSGPDSCDRSALGVGVLIGLFRRAMALSSGMSPMALALTMTFTVGIKGPLDFSCSSARTVDRSWFGKSAKCVI
jgi:hypothetical protein